MQTFIDHARSFREHAARNGEEFHRLAEGQSPQALFIACSDSRVIPSLFTGARPGELFELRTAGNIVPKYRLGHPTGEAATIEFAIEVLGVSDVVVCGHSHCGAVGAMTRGDDLAAVPAVRGWLAGATAEGPAPPAETGGDYAGPVQQHVLRQLDRLRAYPSIRRRQGDGAIGLHAWYYEVHTGSVLAHRPDADAFLPL
ncbi:carbonic anhydrase [Actinomadura rayongensis]|uniref:Carbonic anhydrase n=1 Tax=Actinomadura rayongensis TaxID=1429076 RepID=A0A6I4WDV0_9ACTN|nr:carbonic anhydrase [Actinomadura rayongensis]MXQ64872.1 carbonic anhydrase [Actinomadura rayongensis]